MEWCDLDEQMVQLGLVASTSYSCSSSLSSTGGGSGGSLVAASAFEAQCVDRGRQLLAMGATALVDGEDLIQVLALFDEALEKAPTLKPFAWERGFALYYLGRFKEAQEQFTASAVVDEDDVEPVLWRFLTEARIKGWKQAQPALADFSGWDRRLCMMQVLELFKGKATVEEVLACTCGDCHSAARASFACALFFEAKGEENMALPMLYAAADVGNGQGGGDTYMLSLARLHLRQLQRRLAAQEASPYVNPGPLTEILSPRRLNASTHNRARGKIVSPLSQSC